MERYISDEMLLIVKFAKPWFAEATACVVESTPGPGRIFDASVETYNCSGGIVCVAYTSVAFKPGLGNG